MIDSRRKSKNTAEAVLPRVHMYCMYPLRHFITPLRRVHVTRAEWRLRIHHRPHNYCIHLGALIIDSDQATKFSVIPRNT